VIQGRQRTISSGTQALFAQGNDRKSAGDLADIANTPRPADFDSKVATLPAWQGRH